MVYNIGIKLIANILIELKSISISNISNIENIILIAVKKLTIEIKAFYKYYIAAISLVYPPLNYYLLIML
jgi:hypothetical protein